MEINLANVEKYRQLCEKDIHLKLLSRSNVLNYPLSFFEPQINKNLIEKTEPGKLSEMTQISDPEMSSQTGSIDLENIRDQKAMSLPFILNESFTKPEYLRNPKSDKMFVFESNSKVTNIDYPSYNKLHFIKRVDQKPKTEFLGEYKFSQERAFNRNIIKPGFQIPMNSSYHSPSTIINETKNQELLYSQLENSGRNQDLNQVRLGQNEFGSRKENLEIKVQDNLILNQNSFPSSKHKNLSNSEKLAEPKSKHKPKMIATCINTSFHKSNRKDKPNITQEPSIKLGNKVFHIPGSILLSEDFPPPPQSKKTKDRRRTLKEVSSSPEPDEETKLRIAQDPFAFVYKKNKVTTTQLAIDSKEIEALLLSSGFGKNIGNDIQAIEKDLESIKITSNNVESLEVTSDLDLTKKPIPLLPLELDKKKLDMTSTISKTTAEPLLDKQASHSPKEIVNLNKSTSNDALLSTIPLITEGSEAPLKPTLDEINELTKLDQCSKQTFNQPLFPSLPLFLTPHTPFPNIALMSSDKPTLNLFETGQTGKAPLFSFASSQEDFPDAQNLLEDDLGMFAHIPDL